VNEAKESLRSDAVKKDKKLKEALQKSIKTAEGLVYEFIHAIDEVIYLQKEVQWLESRFPDGKYVNVAGLCKVVSKEEIEANDYSLTAGRYVGVAPQIDEDFDYEERMAEIKLELQGLNEEAEQLAKQIQIDLNDLGL
jgi:type I restriction enzyme M protein